MAARVTVIIPVFNRQETIARAIRSVLDQSHRELQLFVVDDGSADASCAVARGFDDPRLRVLRHPENRGAAAARNTALAQSRTEYAAFLDSDDEWLPHKLERQLALMERLGSSFALCFTAALLHVNGTEKKTVVGSPPRDLTRYFQVDNRFIFSSLLFRRASLSSSGCFNERFRSKGMEDLEWLHRMSRGGRLVYLVDPLVRKYEWPEQEPELREEHTELLLGELRAELDGIGAGYRKRVEALWWTRLARMYCRTHHLNRGWELLKRSLRVSPATALPNLAMFTAEFLQTYSRVPILPAGKYVSEVVRKKSNGSYWVTG